MASSKYSDQIVNWLAELGYTHCFFVAGGNIMHLLDSVRTRMNCVPFVHEVGASIAVEHFNATRDEDGGRAFALVTAGPGLTNAVTAIAGAYQESRELLILGGQVKSSDLSHGAVRQRGIQEIDGVTLVSSVTKVAKRIERPVSREEITTAVLEGRRPRQGPVFLEFCLDAQAAPVVPDHGPVGVPVAPLPQANAATIERVAAMIAESSRPVVLIGGGVSRNQVRCLHAATLRAGIPLMTTWNGADRVPNEHPLFAGRPNTWGQRSANILIQQADLVLAVGTRLGLQQTGFAWQQFVPVGKIVQVDIDGAELEKGHPHLDLGVAAGADEFLRDLYAILPEDAGRLSPWRDVVAEVRSLLSPVDPNNVTGEGYVEPFELGMAIADVAGPQDVLLPGSSGGAFTVWMQSLRLRANQKLACDKGAASMGYGLPGAIGAALANPTRRVFLAEGDGGFAQNLQELGTLAAVGLPVKVLLMANDGYASIRMTQRNYFDGAWIGCDSKTGLGLPDWSLLAKAYGLDYVRMDATTGLEGAEVSAALASPRPVLIEVPIDPDQTYFPKITSAVQPDGSMRSNPLHQMDPRLDEELAARVMPYLPKE